VALCALVVGCLAPWGKNIDYAAAAPAEAGYVVYAEDVLIRQGPVEPQESVTVADRLKVCRRQCSSEGHNSILARELIARRPLFSRINDGLIFQQDVRDKSSVIGCVCPHFQINFEAAYDRRSLSVIDERIANLNGIDARRCTWIPRSPARPIKPSMDEHIGPLYARYVLSSDSSRASGYLKVAALYGPDHDQQAGENRQEHISNLGALQKIFGAIAISGAGLVAQMFGLRQMTSKRCIGIGVWLIGVALGFAGPFAVLWNVI